MFNKFELLGIGASIMSMALALYLINLETSVLTSATDSSQLAQTAVVTVGNGTDDKTELRNALLEGTNQNGTVEKLIIDDVVIGGGREAKTGDTVSVHYVGTLPNGQEFDNSNKRGEPFGFTLGEGRVIKGWEEGVVGMKVGGKRILVIPSDLAYGDLGYGPIPGKATLVFSIELLEVR
jgi:FKBP-type peptidyl-prolyl cis-trans isomerase